MAGEAKNVSDFQTVIRILQEKRGLIDAAIQSVVAASGAFFAPGDNGPMSFTGGSGDSQSVELPRGAFLGKSLPAAIKLYLHAARQQKSIREIAVALKEGGIVSTSDNFEGVVTGCLNRLKANGELLRFKDGWGLAEFYPAALRNRLTQETAPKKKAGAKKTKKTQKTTGAAEIKSVPGNSGLEQRIEAYMTHTGKGKWVSAGEIVNAVNAEPKSFPLVMGRLVKKHGWEKNQEGRFRAQMQQVM